MKSKNKLMLVPAIMIAVVTIIVIAAGTVNCEKTKNIYYDEVIEYSEKSELEPELVFAVIKAESGFDASAVSKKNAVGLMQILPSTAAYIAETVSYDGKIDLKDPKINVAFGCAYLKYLWEKFGGEREVLCAYNAGEGTVKKWLESEVYSQDGINVFYIPFGETRLYVEKVLSFKEQFRGMLIKKGYYEQKRQSV